MLTDEQIEAIAQTLYHKTKDGFWEDLSEDQKSSIKQGVEMVGNTAIALQAEQDRKSLTAIGKYLGIMFTAQTDVVSEVYKKLDEIMTVFREHSQEIAIAQQIKTLNKQLEQYLVKTEQKTSTVPEGAVGKQKGRSVHTRKEPSKRSKSAAVSKE
jgi:hypothetical protein